MSSRPARSGPQRQAPSSSKPPSSYRRASRGRQSQPSARWSTPTPSKYTLPAQSRPNFPAINWVHDGHYQVAVFQRSLRILGFNFSKPSIRCWQLDTYKDQRDDKSPDLARAIGWRRRWGNRQDLRRMLGNGIALDVPCGHSDNALDHALREGEFRSALDILQHIQMTGRWIKSRRHDPLYVLLACTRDEFYTDEAAQCCRVILEMRRILGVKSTRPHGHNGIKCIHIAAFRGNRGILELLMALDSSVSKTIDDYGNTALHYAVTAMNIESIRILCAMKGRSSRRHDENDSGVRPTEIAERWVQIARNERTVTRFWRHSTSHYATDQYSTTVLMTMLECYGVPGSRKFIKGASRLDNAASEAQEALLRNHKHRNASSSTTYL